MKLECGAIAVRAREQVDRKSGIENFRENHKIVRLRPDFRDELKHAVIVGFLLFPADIQLHQVSAHEARVVSWRRGMGSSGGRTL